MTVRYRPLAATMAVALGIAMTIPTLHGDEGMWLYSSPPLKQLKEKYGFEPTQQWLEHIQKSSVRFNSGGSGSFVSADGLVMTNHHVGADDLQKLSDIRKVDYLKTGFAAKTKAEEIKCADLELNVLMDIKDVTAEVNAAVKSDLTPAQAFKARQQKIAELEKGTADEAKGVRADVVTLYAGGAYHLYTFKKYTDIRLVFAPEKQIAFFGGDPDNFEYPRYDLDMCFFRVYENDQPVKPEHYLKWSANGAAENELTFVSGHPGRTNRQNTIAELEYLRDVGYPYLLQRLNRYEVLLKAWCDRSEENRQKGEDDLFGIQNSRKARIGGLAGPARPEDHGPQTGRGKASPRLHHRQPRQGDERRRQGLRHHCRGREGPGEDDRGHDVVRERGCVQQPALRVCPHAPALLRRQGQAGKRPSARIRRRPAAVPQGPALHAGPDDDALEILKLADGLTFLATTYGADDETVKKVLAGKSPRERAFELVSNTKVKSAEFRKVNFEAGTAPLEDPMIGVAKIVDEKSRALRKQFEEQVDEPKRGAGAALAKARFAMDGTNSYPDATFTLRLSYGTVKGFKEDGVDIPPFTTMAGLYERSAKQENRVPFDLPPRWVERKAKLDLTTPFNFVSTADIIGGNSGSPVVNKAGEVVGLIFDGNIQSLVLDFIYDHDQARAVSVDSRAMIEALRKVYDADWLADELTKK